MGEENVELQMENDLKALFAGQEPAPATGADPGSNAKVTPGTKQEVAASQPPAETPDDSDASDASDTSDASDASDAQLTDREKQLKALNELQVEEPKKEDGPKLSEDQEIILKYIPDAQTAAQLVQIANNHVAFEQAFESGKFDDVTEMFTQWNPKAFDAFLEHIYQKHVATGDWVTRFVEEKEAERDGRRSDFKRQSKLEQELQDLRKQVQQREQRESSARAEQAERQVFQNYTNEVDKLFEKVGITEDADKSFIRAAVNASVVKDKKVVAEIRAGKYEGLRGIFKTHANTYLLRDQTFTQKTEAKIKTQDQKKPLVSGGTANTQTDDAANKAWKDVKKGEEDATLVAKLGSFFASKKKK